ncbi:hypothetical protein GGR50DRAFT_691690 [Xylaria sp. CBS 124048]|nr:hypothetical protein GGR50DRAFT_691690 [Xylaria sp. CBS 124048]
MATVIVTIVEWVVAQFDGSVAYGRFPVKYYNSLSDDEKAEGKRQASIILGEQADYFIDSRNLDRILLGNVERISRTWPCIAKAVPSCDLLVLYNAEDPLAPAHQQGPNMPAPPRPAPSSSPGKRSASDALGDCDQPKGPKRPCNSFMLYRSRRSREIGNVNTVNKNGDVSRTVAAEWNAMSDEDKEHWRRRAKEPRAQPDEQVEPKAARPPTEEKANESGAAQDAGDSRNDSESNDAPFNFDQWLLFDGDFLDFGNWDATVPPPGVAGDNNVALDNMVPTMSRESSEFIDPALLAPMAMPTHGHAQSMNHPSPSFEGPAEEPPAQEDSSNEQWWASVVLLSLAHPDPRSSARVPVLVFRPPHVVGSLCCAILILPTPSLVAELVLLRLVGRKKCYSSQDHSQSRTKDPSQSRSQSPASCGVSGVTGSSFTTASLPHTSSRHYFGVFYVGFRCE